MTERNPAHKRGTVGISLDYTTIDKIDSQRGQVPRSRYLETMALRGMEEASL